MDDSTQQYPAPEGRVPPPNTWAPPQGAPFTGQEPAPKKKMATGKKIGLWTGGILVAFAAVAATADDPKTTPTATAVVSSSAAKAASAPTPTVAAPADTSAADKAAADKAAAD
ncbi:MAG: hypothetical protein HOU81_07800, partial [Hamadaea sp.]|nr:hypothetical protein [Hamadaea sp.]